MNGRQYFYTLNCVNADGEAIQDMCEQSREITWRAFIKHISINEIKHLFPTYDWNGKGLYLKNDFAVSFYRSKYKGKRCYYIEHSGIEYIFM